MKVKMSWFSFLPAVFLIMVIKILELAGVSQLFEVVSASYMSVIVVVLSYVANLIFSALDKKTSPVHLLERNFPAGAFALLSAACIASKSFLSIIQALQHHTYELFDMVTCGFGIVASVSMVILSLGHIQGKNYMPRIGVPMLSISVWLCLVLTSSFLETRTLSAVDIDPIRNFTFIFAMILFLNVPMVVATVDGKNAVKNCFVYGFPMATLGILYGVNTVQDVLTEGFDYSENVVSMTFLFMAVYIILFNIELTRTAKTVDEQEVAFDADDFEEFEDYYGLTKDEPVIPEGTYYDSEGYFYGYDYENPEEVIEGYVLEKNEDYVEQEYEELVAEDLIVKAENEEIDEDRDAIFISKDEAEIFEQNIITINEKNQQETAEDEAVVSKAGDVKKTTEEPVEKTETTDEVKVTEPSEDKGQFDSEIETIDKIDRLLAEIGSIDEI